MSKITKLFTPTNAQTLTRVCGLRPPHTSGAVCGAHTHVVMCLWRQRTYVSVLYICLCKVVLVVE